MPSIILSNLFDYQALLDIEFSSYLIKQQSSEITRKNYITDLRNFFKWLNNSVTTGSITLREEKEKPLRSISTEIIESFKRALIISQTPTATINRRLSALRMFFQFAVIEQKIIENPMVLIRNIPRIDALNSASTLNEALTQYANEMKTSASDIDDIRSFFSWYYQQYIS